MPVLPAMAVTALLLGAPASAAEPPAHTVGEMVEQLRDDPILVQPSMGMGDSARAHDVLTSAADGLDLPVYVVLADVPDDLAGTDLPAEAAAALLRAELGDGLYHVEFRDEISYTRSWGGGELDDAYLAPVTQALERAESNAAGEYPRASALFEAVLTVRWAAAPEEALPNAVVDEYAAQPWAFVADSDRSRADATSARWVTLLATVSGLVVAGTIITLVVARRSRGDARVPARTRRGRPSSTSVVPDDIATTAQRRLDDARERLAKLPAAQVSGVHGEAAATAIEAGDRVLATGDPLDAVGATVLAAVAVREVERAGSPKRQPYRPCFVNPLHGEARDTARIDGSSIDAPVCRDCARTQGRFLAARRRLRGPAPYTDTSTVWARTGFGALVGDLAAQVLDDRSARR
ncbi:hypothetical protein [Jiangella alkaliphila]|uniref:Uncharacterized protein n=1 Tax=Jiangella alkaliphila TaxID=419479 RepID=A0A1H2K2M4_9ACTN|nr:hypothetical protein [Jiangella alkaliphila]SDU62964.1 hypothetical protein SAMN04488563_3357 [Jiangella alkaliphila]